MVASGFSNVGYSVDEVDGITVVRVERRLSLDEFLEVIDRVGSAYDSRRRLWLLADTFDLTAGEIEKLADRGRRVWPSPSRVAYVASNDLGYGLLRSFEVYREEEGYDTRVFRDEASSARMATLGLRVGGQSMEAGCRGPQRHGAAL